MSLSPLCTLEPSTESVQPENIMISETGELILTDLGSVTEGDVYIPSQKEALLLQEKASQMTSMPYRAPGTSRIRPAPN